MAPDTDPVVVAARRSPLAVRGRGLTDVDAGSLAGTVIAATVADAESPPIADVVLGNCTGPGGNLGRIAALAAGLGTGVPGGTVDRQCGSGLAAIMDAAHATRADGRARVAGGVESASTAPVRVQDGAPYARAPFAPAGFADPDMLRAAEDLAAHDALTRERQDAYARRSHARATTARASGRFDAEIVPVAGVSRDEGIGTSAALLARLAPLMTGGTVTAGTSTRIGDGAAAVVVAPAGSGPGLAIRATAVIGCDPALPGIGAAPAIQAALTQAGRSLTDVAAIELVEAFAAQSIAVLSRLGLRDDDERVCAEGGALALGHPWGASGAVAVVRLFSRLVRAGAPAGTLGLAAASVGGGLGVAAVFEVVR
ncbi:acetyl-CoA acetyltransferase [Microbacterium testaceum StLB037]|uniref:Acetyl-CoA acetyltransferase n=1 Tax=Microbacterium testaceum (strain StLB037) TaxID=979556 RepID=E8NCN8_MICTS|nr:thiolase family protein [Microbacterium testaceum]BAJ74907.1 acetyl-CoA acetyltransferase [Microbacterium testaceum StLB037]